MIDYDYYMEQRVGPQPPEYPEDEAYQPVSHDRWVSGNQTRIWRLDAEGNSVSETVEVEDHE